jgi:hypothetical protein
MKGAHTCMQMKLRCRVSPAMLIFSVVMCSASIQATAASQLVRLDDSAAVVQCIGSKLQPLKMGAASSYVVFAGAALTVSGPSIVAGDMGTGLATDATKNGVVVIYGTSKKGLVPTGPVQQAIIAARIDANNRTITSNSSDQFPKTGGSLANIVLRPGVYFTASALGLLYGQMVFDAEGDVDAVWIIRSNGALTTAAGTVMHAIHGANPRNIFFVLEGAATFGAGSVAMGTYITVGAITGGAGSKLGPVLSEKAVTLASSIVTFDNNYLPSL